MLWMGKRTAESTNQDQTKGGESGEKRIALGMEELKDTLLGPPPHPSLPTSRLTPDPW